MKEVVLDAVIDIRDLADVKQAIFQLEVLEQFGPSVDHHLHGLSVIQTNYQKSKVCQVRSHTRACTHTNTKK